MSHSCSVLSLPLLTDVQAFLFLGSTDKAALSTLSHVSLGTNVSISPEVELTRYRWLSTAFLRCCQMVLQNGCSKSYPYCFYKFFINFTQSNLSLFLGIIFLPFCVIFKKDFGFLPFSAASYPFVKLLLPAHKSFLLQLTGLCLFCENQEFWIIEKSRNFCNIFPLILLSFVFVLFLNPTGICWYV